MKIRQGQLSDLPIIMDFVEKTVDIMSNEGNDQWTSTYPQEDDFKKDIENNNLFIAVKDDRPVGSITIDNKNGENYEHINWTYAEKNFFVIHRLAVDPEIRGGGIASELLAFAEVYAIEHDIYYLKTDTYSLNDKAQNLFVKNGYNKVGTTHFEGKENPFYCYDKSFL
ncbi:GNAT family N-acetyltransferase [Niallia sp. 01092]|uniref:GNAT family N-acetyltransferase n=1 Tax=unclassified Niallia TaxID=2837522 RepID=UPI003FD2E0B8